MGSGHNQLSSMSTDSYSFIARHWELILLLGSLKTLFGLFAFAWPEITLESLSFFMWGRVLSMGFASLVTGVRRSRDEPDRWLIFTGFLAIIAGMAVFVGRD